MVCYTRNDLSFDAKPFFPPEIENVFFEILLPNTKAIVVGIIYQPSSQSEFLEIINTHFSNWIQTIMKSTYLAILTLTSILITHTFLKKIICFKANQFLVASKIL